MTDGQLIDTTPIVLPTTIRNMMRRALNDVDFANFLGVQMFAIRYWSQGLRISGFLALPPAQSVQSYAGLIFNRGGIGPRGALSAESAYATAGLYASWGYVCVASNYRGQGGSEGVEEWGARDVDDAANCIPLLASLGYVDMQRLGIVGGSRGGMMALMMLRSSSAFRAAVTIGAPTVLHSNDPHSPIRKTFSKFVANDEQMMTEMIRRSAGSWAAELCKTTPLLVLHGSGDKRVDAMNAIDLARELQHTLHPYKLIIYDNADHILAGRREESNADIRWWLDHYVMNKSALPIVGPHGN